MTGIPCMLMRGGTSKGAYFLSADLPHDQAVQNDLLLNIMGSPDPRQVDGIGGGHPLTSKVAIISPASRGDADVDYLFKQVGVGEATVSDRQNCGNLLAGVAPFAVERGLVRDYPVRIHMVNTGEVAVATVAEPGTYILEFPAAGELLPTGNVRDVVDGLDVTCADAGMPVVVVAARDLGHTGYETVAELEADEDLARRVRSLRLAAGQLMGLGDVSETTVPKVTLVAAPKSGGLVCTRTFIPVRVHESIGVLGAVSVASAVLTPGAAGHDLADVSPGQTRFDIEHPSGAIQVDVEPGVRAGVVRTARKLFDGVVFPREN
jgi:4-oxalomesaconate tautomerase